MKPARGVASEVRKSSKVLKVANHCDLIALIPCAGTGERYGQIIPKQYSIINDKSILEHTLQPFIASLQIKQIILVAKSSDTMIDAYQKLSTKIIIKKVGGDTRAESVRNGLQALECKINAWVLVHDAVRCCLTEELLNKLIDELKDDDVGGILAANATDTVKYALKNGTIEIDRTIPRDHVYLAQTPQMFRYNMLLQALSLDNLTQITDEASAIEMLGLKVKIVESCMSNIKVTNPIDKKIAEVLLKSE